MIRKASAMWWLGLLPGAPRLASELACDTLEVSALDNGLALTPPMGWMTWERYGCQIDERMIRAMADRMAEALWPVSPTKSLLKPTKTI